MALSGGECDKMCSRLKMRVPRSNKISCTIHVMMYRMKKTKHALNMLLTVVGGVYDLTGEVL